MKQYILTSITGNGQQYEDFSQNFSVEGVYSSLELAEKAKSLLPKIVNMGNPTDGEILMVEPDYYITEKELDLMPKITESCPHCHHPINEHHADCKRFDEHPSECDADEQENNMRAIALEEADMLEHQHDDYQSRSDIEAQDFHDACGDR